MSLFTRAEPRLRFESLQTESDVADALSESLVALQQLKDEAFKGPLYEPIHLPKKGKRRQGEERIVYGVAREIRRLHTEILESLRAQTKVSDHAFGFVRGRSIKDNALVHHGCHVLLNVDIKDFFDSIREPQVVKSFRALGAGESATRLLAAICCLQGSLPQGAATSPILSNLVCSEMDQKLAELAARKHARYTRYADDISFSGEVTPEIEQVKNVLDAYGFMLNEQKTSKRMRGQAQYVTGLTIGSALGVRLPKRLRRYLRLQLYYAHQLASKSGEAKHDNNRRSDAQLSGLLAYVYSVEPTWAVSLMKKFPLGVPSDWTQRAPSIEEREP
jgi:RNA-directed DNA polymerase